MTILTNFKTYVPDDEEAAELISSFNILYLKSSEGVDWYDAQKLFKEDGLKVVFRWDTGRIISVGTDVSTLWPIGACVADVDYDTNATIQDFVDKVFNPRKGTIETRVKTVQELRLDAEQEVATRITEATRIITPLQYAKELDMLEEDEAVYLQNLQRYVVLLHRVASQKSYPTTIDWPTMPTK